MAGFEIDIPKQPTPSPGSVPKIPLGVVGNPGMEKFGQQVQGAANTAASTVNLWNSIQKQEMQQRAYTATMDAMLTLKENDLQQYDQTESDALSDPNKLPELAKTHYEYLKQKVGELQATLPKDVYAEHHWAQATKQYLSQRLDELRMKQANLVVADFDTTTKRLLTSHESHLASAQSLDELNSIEDTQTLRDFDQGMEAGIRNRVVSRSKVEETRLAVLGNFQRIRFNRMLELDPQVAGVKFRENGMARTEDILKAVPDFDQAMDTRGMSAADIEKTRDARKARIASVAKNFIYGGHADQQTVMGLNDIVHFDDKTYDDLMNTVTRQANNVYTAQEHQIAKEKLVAEKQYNTTMTDLWGKLFKRGLTRNDIDAAVGSHIFDNHQDTYHALEQAFKSQHQEDLGENAEKTRGTFLETEVKIKSNPNAPDVQPEAWAGSNMSFGQKSSLYSTLREWKDKLNKDPRLHSDQFNFNKDRLVNDTGGAMLTFNAGGNASDMLQLRGVLLSMYTERVLKGDSPDKAYGTAHKYALEHPVMGAGNDEPLEANPGYVPPTNDQINQMYAPGSPAWYDAIEERQYQEDLLRKSELKKKKDAETAAQQKIDEANRSSIWNGYGLFRK